MNPPPMYGLFCGIPNTIEYGWVLSFGLLVLTSNAPDTVPETVSLPFGVVVPIPILLPDWNIIELDIVLDELNSAILWVVPGPTGENEADVANDAVPVNEPLIEPVSPAPTSVNPLLEISNDPVMTALPENGNPAVAPPAFNAYDAVIALDALTAQEEVPKNEPEYIPSAVLEPPDSTSTCAEESALEDDVVLDDDIAHEAVPRNPTAFEIELVYDDAETLPCTCNDALGAVVPIPILPDESIVTRCPALVKNAIELFALL
jgi:hypothetical protein